MLKTFPKGGVHPPENKLTTDKQIEVLPIPKQVIIPVAQHIGAPAKVIVNKKDKIKTGQIIAESGGFVSANIHSSVSGTVLRIDNIADASGYKRTAVVINVEGDEWDEDIERGESLKKECNFGKNEILKKIQDAGIVGLGGATFPTHVKLLPPKGMKAEVLIINGVECEPYLTADHRLMLEKGEEILIGTEILMKALGVNKAVIGIENNKPGVISYLTSISKNYTGISVVALKIKYPQGGEKQLIKAVTGREVPSGELPIFVGAVVHNVGTVFAVYEAVQKNKPLFERIVTVTGKSLADPKNLLVRIGTPVKNLIEFAGGLPEDTGKVISGGPMMGKALNSTESTVTKGTSGMLVLPKTDSKRIEIKQCIRCAKCVGVCPMGLERF
ncbi:MAG: electron transport complex subunit RsxC, partial [Bacteroidales bacterium]|nr:electron transport complex subunit RsxC [Bacteroidales bacterium]